MPDTSRLYEDGGRQAAIDYMAEPATCDHCNIPTTRRGMFIHTQHPCPELLASQLAGEEILARIAEQTERDPEPF